MSLNPWEAEKLAHPGLAVLRQAAMTVRLQLDDRQWSRIEAFLQTERGRGRPARNDRLFVEAVLWNHRTGAPWRDLPSEFGPWQTVFNRFDRWSKTGKWQRLLRALQVDVDGEWFCIDATIARAHQHAAGAKGGAQKRGARSGHYALARRTLNKSSPGRRCSRPTP